MKYLSPGFQQHLRHLQIHHFIDVHGALARHLDLPPGRLTVVGDGRPDLRIRMNGTLIETRLQAWGERLAALVEDL